MAKILATVILVLSFCARANADVADSPKERQLFLSKEGVTLAIPKDDWVIFKEQRRADGLAVYYAMVSEKRGMNFSVFIERTSICSTGSGCLALALKNPGYKDAKDLKTYDKSGFNVAQFYLDQPMGFNVKHAHILASAYVNGEWIDIHLSMAAHEMPDTTAMPAFLEIVSLR